MPLLDVDFHIHSKYSGGTSSNMELPLIAKQAELKGLHLVGTGDSLHPKWLSHIKRNLFEESDGIYGMKNNSKTKFIIQTEVEDSKRVHHVILFPSISSAESLYEMFKRFSHDIDRDGRAHLRINGDEIVDYAMDVNALVGPAHAFTPWTSLYKEYNSLSECYGDNTKNIKFLELGLSADTYMADRIPELQDITFMSNSDTHSPWPHRLGREFNRIKVKELTFLEIEKAIEHKNNRGFTLNVGLNPKEGKYHITACSKCYLKFKINDAIRLNFRCPECNGIIKKGVMDRVNELSKWKEPKNPWHRPKYIHIIPLAEVISLATGISTITSKRIKDKWNLLIDKFGTEINILVDTKIDKIKEEDYKIGMIIEKFRMDKINYISGGGGLYGRPTLRSESDRYWGYGQSSLSDFLM